MDSEVFRNLTDPTSAVSRRSTLERDSSSSALQRTAPAPHCAVAATATGDAPDTAYAALTGGADATLSTTGLATKLTEAMSRLTSIEPFVFNILCIPAMALLDATNQGTVVNAASTFCSAQRAFLLVDPPEATMDGDRRPGAARHCGTREQEPRRSTTRGC